MTTNIFKNDIGTELIFYIGVSVDSINEAKIYYKKPDGTAGEWIAEPITGTNEIKYTIQEGDLNQSGEYLLQPYVDFGNWKGRGSIVKLNVKDII